MFKRNSCALKTAFWTCVVALVLSMSSILSAENSGEWVPNNSASGCPSSGFSTGCGTERVCADWDVDGESLMSCCIDSQYLGTSSLGACS